MTTYNTSQKKPLQEFVTFFSKNTYDMTVMSKQGVTNMGCGCFNFLDGDCLLWIILILVVLALLSNNGCGCDNNCPSNNGCGC
ncbi:MAG: hypothetical protein E7385_05745 [Ruminococcaceae bacterium]|nr:hypothetical protein [Oscillospiraceae bacterium]